MGETGDDTVLSVSIDGGEAELSPVYKTGFRDISYMAEGLENGHHTAKITVAMGSYSVDGMQVTGGDIPLPEEEIIEETAADETEDIVSYDAENASAETGVSEKKKSGAAVPIVIGAAAAAGIAAAIIISKKKKK